MRRGWCDVEIARRRIRIASTELDPDRITLLERLTEIQRIWTGPAREVRSVAVGWKPDESYTRREIVCGVVHWYKIVNAKTERMKS